MSIDFNATADGDLGIRTGVSTKVDGAGAVGRRAGAWIVVVIITASLEDDGGQGGRGQPTKTYQNIVSNNEFCKLTTVKYSLSD
jgi:hypothetical protein